MTPEVYSDIKEFLRINMPGFRKDAREYGELELTVAVSDDGSQWSYQTGDNSYTGGAYSLPHWAVTTIMPDSEHKEVYSEIISQLEELTETWPSDSAHG